MHSLSLSQWRYSQWLRAHLCAAVCHPELGLSHVPIAKVNIVTAIFVDAATERTRHDRELNVLCGSLGRGFVQQVDPGSTARTSTLILPSSHTPPRNELEHRQELSDIMQKAIEL